MLNLVLVTAISMHALLDLHTKLASSDARTASYDTSSPPHAHNAHASLGITAVAQSLLEQLRTRRNDHSLAVLAIASRLCIAFVYTSSMAVASIS